MIQKMVMPTATSPTSPGERQNTTQEDRLKVVIVEPHHHALEHIHEILRRQRRLGKSWSLCHIDAHPDLACPSKGIPAGACFRPRDEWTVSNENHNEQEDETRCGCLYELLDLSSTGISEWILPMVLAAGNLESMATLWGIRTGSFSLLTLYRLFVVLYL